MFTTISYASSYESPELEIDRARIPLENGTVFSPFLTWIGTFLPCTSFLYPKRGR